MVVITADSAIICIIFQTPWREYFYLFCLRSRSFLLCSSMRQIWGEKLVRHLFGLKIKRQRSCCIQFEKTSISLNKDSHIHCNPHHFCVVSFVSHSPSPVFPFHLVPPSIFYTIPLSSHFYCSNRILVSLLCAFEEEGGPAIVIRPLIIVNNSQKNQPTLLNLTTATLALYAGT